MGRGPMETKTYILKDMILIRLKGVLTPAEEQLAKTTEGAELIKKTRVRLLEGARLLLENIIFNITNCQVRFEFGKIGEEIILVDEIFTFDSSRFWSKDKYKPGRSQPSFDKQFVRDYLDALDWNKKPPAPSLPQEIVDKTAERYLQAFRIITGKELHFRNN